jgi:hypothetical protein
MAGSNIYIDKRLWSSQTFSSNGTFNVPLGVNLVLVEMYGGGGGGAFMNPDVGMTSYVVYGGEAGERIHAHIPVTPGASIPVVIGVGGNGGFSPSTGITVGDNGTSTTFGSFKSRGGLGGGGAFMEGIGGEFVEKGAGRGRDSFRATGIGGINVFGGDAGYGNGGALGADGGIGAGGGAVVNVGTAGDGGDGICIVSWRQE